MSWWGRWCSVDCWRRCSMPAEDPQTPDGRTAADLSTADLFELRHRLLGSIELVEARRRSWSDRAASGVDGLRLLDQIAAADRALGQLGERVEAVEAELGRRMLAGAEGMLADG